METFLWRVFDSFNFKLLEKGEIYFMKTRTLQCEIQWLQIPKMIEISKNVVSPSITIFQKRIHVERIGYVLYVHKCAKIEATLTKLPYCRKISCVNRGSQLFFYLIYRASYKKFCVIFIQLLPATCCTKCQFRRRQFSSIEIVKNSIVRYIIGRWIVT